MNDVLVTFSVLLVALLWRATTFYCVERLRPKNPADELHWLLYCLAWLPRWSTLLFAGVGYLLARTVWDFYRWEVQQYGWLSSDRVGEALGTIPGMTPSEREQLAIHEWLKWGALVAPVVGVLAAALVAYHAWELVCHEAQHMHQRWRTSYEVDLVLMVVAMPLVFTLMAMRAEVRILAVMTGSAWQTVVEAGSPPISWPDLKASEMSMYTAELQVACVFQYCTLWNIGALCAHYMKDISEEYRFTLKWAGLQGIGFNVLVGIVVSLGNMLAPACSLNEDCRVNAEWWQQTGLPTISPIALASTALCMHNIRQIGFLTVVRHRLERWNAQMGATKALLIFTQWQVQLISAFTIGSSMYKLASKYCPSLLSGYNFSAERAALLHALLLNVECFAVIFANWWMWDPHTVLTEDDDHDD